MLSGIPHFDQWLGVWAIREEDFLSGYQWFLGMDLHLHLQTTGQQVKQEAAAGAPALNVQQGIASIELKGSLMKQRASMSRNTSTVEARRQVRAAARNPDVNAILLFIESPGGTAAGTKELADDVAAAAKQKPVYAYIEDLGASAAYWIASQATKVFANPTAIVGSIGTYGVIYDYSAMAAKEGIKAHVVRAGAMKGAGTPGTEITAEQLAEQQKIVTDLNEFFIRGVKAGRGLTLEATRELADGRVYVGQAAVERKLIDGVQSLDETFSNLAAIGRKRSNRMSVDIAAEASANAETQTSLEANTAKPQPTAAPAAPRPATLAELKAVCPGADAAFLVSQIEANATISQSQTAFMAKLASDNASLSRENRELTAAKPTQSGDRKPGANPVPAGAGRTANANNSAADESEPISAFESAVSELTAKGMDRANAIDTVARKQPELHRSYLLATNGDRSAAVRMLKEKYNV